MAVKIEVIESDNFRGKETYDWMVCLTEEDAKVFEKKYNARNTSPTAPEWYRQVEGEPIPIDLNIFQLQKLRAKGRVWLSDLEDLQ